VIATQGTTTMTIDNKNKYVNDKPISQLVLLTAEATILIRQRRIKLIVVRSKETKSIGPL
jgi:hypothetical protein